MPTSDKSDKANGPAKKIKYVSINNPKTKIIKKDKPNNINNHEPPKNIPLDFLDKNEIKQRLYNYEPIDASQLSDLKPPLRLQYFDIDPDGTYKYRPGGILTLNKYPDYFIITNGKRSWSVQLDRSVFFKEVNIESLRNSYEEIIKTKDRQLDHYRNYVIQLKQEISELKNK